MAASIHLVDLQEYGPVRDWATLIHETDRYSPGELMRAATLIVDDPGADPAALAFVAELRENVSVIQAIARHPRAKAPGNDLLLKLKFDLLHAQVQLPADGAKWDPVAADRLIRQLKAPTETALWVAQYVKDSLTVQDGRTWYVFDDGLWSAIPDAFAQHYAWFRAVVAHLPERLATVGFTLSTYELLGNMVTDYQAGIARLKRDKDDPDRDEKIAKREGFIRDLRSQLAMFDKELIPIIDTGLERIFPKVMEALKPLSNMQTPGAAFDANPAIIVTPSYAINLKQAAERRSWALDNYAVEGFYDPAHTFLGASFVPRRELAGEYLTRSAAIDPVTTTGAADEHDYDSQLLWHKAPHFMSILRYQWGTLDVDNYEDSLDDEELWTQVRALQRLLGYAVTGFQSGKCSIALIGPANTGKSTFTRAVKACFGEYCSQPDPSVLIPKRGESVRPEDLVKIYGSRLAILAEVPIQKIDSGTWKALTGGDSIMVRRLYQQAIDWQAQTKILIVGNNPPIMDNDAASRHRFVAVPFKRPVVKADGRLDDRIARETPYITRWILEGALDWYYDTYVNKIDAQEAFQLPTAWREYSQELIESVDTYHDFFTDWVVDSNEYTWHPSTRLYRLFEIWCAQTGNRPPTMNAFGRLMRARDFDKARIGEAKITSYRCSILSGNPEVSSALLQVRDPQ